jgi:cytochrome P450
MTAAAGEADAAALTSGLAWDAVNPAQLEDPYPIYARARRDTPVAYSERVGAWIITRYEDVCAVLKDPARFSSADVLKVKLEPPESVRAILAEGLPPARTLLDNDPPAHTRFRSLVNKAFVPQRVTELEPKIHAMVEELIDGFIEDGRCEFMRRFAFPLPGAAIADILGLPREDLGDLKRWCDDWMALQSATQPAPELERCAKSYLELQRYFVAAVEERSRAPRGDLMSALIRARLEGESPLSQVELVRVIMSLLVAGHETTTHLLGNALVLLLRNPVELEALRADSSLAAGAVEEALRMDPPIQSLFRRATDDVELGGVNIPKGARVMIVFGSANRDEACFVAPDQFDIRREDAHRHLGFSRGNHFCLGASMARMEARIALARLTTRLPRLRLEQARALERIPHFFLRGYKRLDLCWDGS